MVTFDRTLEIIRIIVVESRLQILKSAPDEDIMRIIAATNKFGLLYKPFINLGLDLTIFCEFGPCLW